ncbi:9859_t:CDS:2 [Diversispora eburnea]|uniref:9859_t:CDS:1 n=1 Tax=Diversispora eburnea TaxID=1213867 RepID=A0A9N8UVU7_9GLOM|nr:9859_t:CDS:2 [Diversispora eburnea]
MPTPTKNGASKKISKALAIGLGVGVSMGVIFFKRHNMKSNTHILEIPSSSDI